MHEFKYGQERVHRDQLNQYLAEKRKAGNFKVLDVGGSVGPWFRDNCDAILDFVPPVQKFDGDFIEGNITLPEGWDQCLNYVKDNGKFDFVICRQTLEDISHPEFVVNMLQKVAKAGWIGVPSKQMELMRGWYPEIPTRGLHHHRWIFVTKNGKWYGLPKMGWTDSLGDRWFNYTIPGGQPRGLELSFYWEKEVNVFWVLPFVDNLPDDYGDDFVKECMKGVKHPWDLWINMINNSDHE